MILLASVSFLNQKNYEFVNKFADIVLIFLR